MWSIAALEHLDEVRYPAGAAARSEYEFAESKTPPFTSILPLKACDTDPASDALPAACSRVTTSFSSEHRTSFWVGLGL